MIRGLITWKTSRGFTFAEVLVGVVLTMLLLSLIFIFLVPTMRASVLGATRAEMQQEALISMDRISADLLNSAACAISLFTPAVDPEKGPLYLGIMRIQDVDPSGVQIWEDAIIVYSWQGPEHPLVRKVWKPGMSPALGVALSPNLPVRLGEAQLRSVALEPNLRGQTLARDVTEFLITSAGLNPMVSSPIDLSLQITRQAATGRRNPESFEINRSVSLRIQM